MPKSAVKLFEPDKDPWTWRLEHNKKLYDAGQNPVFAWRAYQLAREARIDPPDWVLRYLDIAAYNLGFLYRAKEGEIRSGVTAALGFLPGGVEVTAVAMLNPASNEAMRDNVGKFNPFNATEERDLSLSNAVGIYERMGLNRADAKRRVVEVYKVHTKTVARALQRFPIKKR